MQFNEPDQVIHLERAKKIRSLKIRVAVIVTLLIVIAGLGWAVPHLFDQLRQKTVAQANLKNATQEVARLTQEKNELEAKLKDAQTSVATADDAKSQLQAKINEQESQLQAFAKQAKACEVIRAKLKL